MLFWRNRSTLIIQVLTSTSPLTLRIQWQYLWSTIVHIQWGYMSSNDAENLYMFSSSMCFIDLISSYFLRCSITSLQILIFSDLQNWTKLLKYYFYIFSVKMKNSMAHVPYLSIQYFYIYFKTWDNFCLIFSLIKTSPSPLLRSSSGFFFSFLHIPIGQDYKWIK